MCSFYLCFVTFLIGSAICLIDVGTALLNTLESLKPVEPLRLMTVLLRRQPLILINFVIL